MSNSKKKSSLIAVPVVTSTLSVSNHDVVAIKINELEQQLLGEKQRITTEKTVIDNKIEEARKVLASSEETQGKNAFDFTALITALTGLGKKAEVKYRTSFTGRELCHALHDLSKEIGEGDAKGALTCKAQVIVTDPNDRHAYEREIDFVRVLDYPAVLIVQRNEVKKLERESNALQKELEKINKQLGDMSTYERQIKATLAKGILSQSDEGRAILAELDSIPGLPKLTLSV